MSAAKTKTVKATKVTTKKAQPIETKSEIVIANTNSSPRMTAIHHLWDVLQAGPVTVEQLAQKVAAQLVKQNKMDGESAGKLAEQAINHQLPYETGQKGRKTVRVRTIKGGKLEWVGGAIRRRSA